LDLAKLARSSVSCPSKEVCSAWFQRIKQRSVRHISLSMIGYMTETYIIYSVIEVYMYTQIDKVRHSMSVVGY